MVAPPDDVRRMPEDEDDDVLTPEELIEMASQGSRSLTTRTTTVQKQHPTNVDATTTAIHAKSRLVSGGGNTPADAAALLVHMPDLQRGSRYISPGAFPAGGSDDDQNSIDDDRPVLLEAVLVQDRRSGSVAVTHTESDDEDDNDSTLIQATRIDASAITKAEPAWPWQKWARYGMASLCLLTITTGMIVALVLVLQQSRRSSSSVEGQQATPSIATIRARPQKTTLYSHHAAVIATQFNETNSSSNCLSSEPYEFILQCQRTDATLLVNRYDEASVALAPPSSALHRRVVYVTEPNAIAFVEFSCEFQVPMPGKETVKEIAENEFVTQSPVSVRFKGHEAMDDNRNSTCSGNNGGAFLRLLRHCGDFPLDLSVSCSGVVNRGLCVQPIDDSTSCPLGADWCIPAFSLTESSWCPVAVSQETPDSFVKRRIFDKMDDFRFSFWEAFEH